MPSKRKKNKRRMRRVQAQRRALEEQYASSGKGTTGVRGVSALVPTRVPVPKTSECPILVQIKTPLAMVAPVDVPAEIPSAEQIVLEVPVTDAVKDKGMMAAEDLTEVLVEPPIEEPAVLEEPKSVIIPLAEVTATIDEPVSIPAESEVTATIDEPVSIPAESEIQVEDRSPVVTETVDIVRGDEAAAGLHAEDSVVKVPVQEETVVTAETLAAIETVTETLTTEVEHVAEAAVEVSEPAVEVVGEPVVEVHTEVTEIMESVHRAPEPEEVPADVHAEPEPVKVSVEAVVLTEALVKPEPEQQSVPLEEPTPLVESTSDPVAEDYVGTESAIPVGVETAITEEQIPEIPTDAPELLSETMAEKIPAPEPVPLPKEIIHAQDEFMAQVETEIKKAQNEFMAQVETEVKKDLAVGGGLTVDSINGCLATTEVAIEG
ncbi:cytadherence high molecular weight protein 1-like isoform X4 [Myxocyprinus asiaticus]|uniref:cytadherence high molecular weight protein 1-like isoform X3 n=1 Tax=Myxocyprinus asiaticus TaxID=70543 RepID=UPI0022236C9C|nr:cytadherence high molecular weight protein 1-like isoform X3 [Myxocyprinus asiaticus]XP_051525477.1 cytadherence high molecular weight protein 1-like isoform X4 [Myxocyprinus asiaticus]